MAKNFTIVRGKGPNGEEINPAPSTSDVDVFEEFFDVKPAVGMIYKEKRHVVRVSCPRGYACNDVAYAKTLSYDNRPLPIVAYIDVTSGKMFDVTSDKFCEWLGKDWVAEEAPESEETKKSNSLLETMGRDLIAEKDTTKADAESDKARKEDRPNWTRVPRLNKSKKQSKK